MEKTRLAQPSAGRQDTAASTTARIAVSGSPHLSCTGASEHLSVMLPHVEPGRQDICGSCLAAVAAPLIGLRRTARRCQQSERHCGGLHRTFQRLKFGCWYELEEGLGSSEGHQSRCAVLSREEMSQQSRTRPWSCSSKDRV